ncbi:MAG: hypothetical protein KF729_21760 [Sandaracinaceae bacterium]|nr:hypothetical protein [Sandaracinaceae bacterium]
MPASDPAPSLARHALIPASLVACFAMLYVFALEPVWLLAVVAPLCALYVAAPGIGRRSLARFDRDALPLLARRDGPALRARLARAIGMHLFAPPARVAERRGMVAAETGAPDRARAAYRAAIGGYPEDRAPVAVRLGLAHACYALGDDREAIRLYRAILKAEGTFPHVERRLAHALARRGEALEDAEELADAARRQLDDAEAQLVRALVHARRGQRGPAKKLLRGARRAEGVDRLREEVEVALEEP